MKKLFTLLLLLATMSAFSAATYTWKGGASNSYGTATNWNPTRTPAVDDILVFDLGNIDGANTANSITVSNVTNETIGQLQIVRATGSATGIKTLTFSGTTTTLTVTGNLTFGFYANGTYCKLADGGNTISVGGNITTTTAQSASCTYHSGTGRIILTGTNSSILSNATSNNEGFQNIELASTATNVTFAGTLQINGDLKLNSSSKLVLGGKTLSINATAGVGGTISGTGVIVGISTSLLYIAGTGPASGVQTVGTIYLDNSSSANCTLNSLMIQRPKAITTLGPGFNNGTENIITVGTLRLEDGTIDDGGNVLVCTGNPTIAITTPGGQTGVHQGTGKIRINRSATGAIVTAGRTVTLNNLEIGSSSGAVAFTVGASTNLTINGTLTMSKASSKFDASGSTVTFQNANTPISLPAAGTITTDASTNLKFGSAGNTGGAAFTIPNNAFTTAPSIASFTVNRDNALTFNNQTLTVSGATTITAGTLAMASTLTANGAVTVNGTFQLNSSSWATGTGAWTYGGSGTLAFNSSSTYGVGSSDVYWPTTNGPINVSVLQGGLTMNTTKTVSGLFQTAATVTNANNLTLNGTSQINAGGYFAAAPVYGGSSTLKYNTGTVYGRTNEWSSTSPASVQISNNSTLNYPNGSVVAAKTLTGNLTVDAGSSFYMDYGSVGQSNPLSIGGNVVLNGNLGLGGAIGGDLNIGGNWSRGASANLYPNSRAVFFNGTGDQTISHTGGEVFDYMGVNKASGTLSSADSIVVNNTLFLTSGKLTLGANNLIIGATGTISGASSASYIVTDGAGKLKQTVGAGTATLFPVGASTTSYDPATVTPTDATAFSVKVSSTLTDAAPSGSYYNSREWNLTPTTPSSTVVSLTPSVLNDLVGAYNVIGHYDADNTYHNYSATKSGSTFTATLNVFSPFVTGTTDIATILNNGSILAKSNIYASNGGIVVENANGKSVSVYSLTGKKVYSANATSDRTSIAAAKGVYIISVDNVKSKVLVK